MRLLTATALAGLGLLALPSAPRAEAERELVREPFTLDHLSSDWEILLPDPDRVVSTAGRLRVEPAVAADWNALGRIRNLVRYRFPLAGRRLTARVAVELAIDSPGHGAALVLYQDDGHWVELAVRGELEGGELRRMVRLTRSSGGEQETVARLHARGPARAPERWVLILEREGDAFRGRIEIPLGPPGVMRRAIVGELAAPGLADVQLVLKTLRREPVAASRSTEFDDVVAVGLSDDAGLGEAPETLRVAYATDFRDAEAFRRDFSVLRPEPRSLALEDGLELVARYGIPGDRWTPIRNLVVLNRPLPRTQGWDVEVELDARFTSLHDDVGVLLYGENGNALWVGHWAVPGRTGDGRRAYLRTVAAGRGATQFSDDAGVRTDVEATTLVFRIERKERGYVAWLDVAGRGWVRVGEADVELMEPRVGLFARSARDRGEVPGAGVRFGRLWVMVEEPAARRPAAGR